MTGWSGKECCTLFGGKLGESRLIPTSVQVSITPTHHHVILPLNAFLFFSLWSCISPSQFAWGSLALSTWMTSALVPQPLGSHTLRNAVIYFSLGLMFIAKPAASVFRSKRSTEKKCAFRKFEMKACVSDINTFSYSWACEKWCLSSCISVSYQIWLALHSAA